MPADEEAGADKVAASSSSEEVAKKTTIGVTEEKNLEGEVQGEENTERLGRKTLVSCNLITYHTVPATHAMVHASRLILKSLISEL